MLSSIAQCEGCPYRERGKGFVPGSGPPDAHVVLIGSGPGQAEVYAKEPFVGSSGQRLDIWLAKASIPRSLCWLDNGVRCQIKVRGKDVAPPKAIAECYQRHWGPQLRQLSQLEWVVTFGSEVSKFLCGQWAGDRAAGTLVEIELPQLNAGKEKEENDRKVTPATPGHL